MSGNNWTVSVIERTLPDTWDSDTIRRTYAKWRHDESNDVIIADKEASGGQWTVYLNSVYVGRIDPDESLEQSAETLAELMTEINEALEK